MTRARVKVANLDYDVNMRTYAYICVHLRIGLDADPDVLATALHLAHSIGYTLNISIGKKLKEVSVENDDIIILIVFVNNPCNVLLINLRACW